jgi:membrane-bound lytic murein transglycosylase A
LKQFQLHRQLIILTLILATLLLAGCSRKPLVAIAIESAPLFTDDLDLDSLHQAVKANIDYLDKQPPEKTILIANHSFPLSRLKYSLEHFQEILTTQPGSEELDRLVKQDYDIFQATGTQGFNPGRKMLITGYFQPVFEGSISRQDPFLYPLYTIPSDLIRTKNNNETGQTYSRLEQNKKIPYWTRREIETENKAAGHELVWLKDPFDAFVLHVQGSGLIRLQDGTVRGVHYAAKNGHTYRSIGKYMVKTGRISLKEASLETIRHYIATHPEERDKILYHNPSFIFFDWTKTHGAIGNLGKELTAGRSIAVDQGCFPAGGLAFLLSRRPTKTYDQQITWNPMRRFVLVQDTGSAIRGAGRVDLFWGTGIKAGFEAGQMKEKGTLYFLIIKDKLLAQTTQS